MNKTFIFPLLIKKDSCYLIYKNPQKSNTELGSYFPTLEVPINKLISRNIAGKIKNTLNIDASIKKPILYDFKDSNGEDKEPKIAYLATTEGELANLNNMDCYFIDQSHISDLSLFKQDQELINLANNAFINSSAFNPPFKHLIWDFDGTLFDSYKQMAQALYLALDSLGITESKNKLWSKLKISLGHAIEWAIENYNLSKDMDLYKIYKSFDDGFPFENIPPYKGIVKLLRILKSVGIKNYIYTHRGQSTLDYLKTQNLLDIFEDIVTKEQGFPYKPAPDALKWLLDKHDIPKQSALMIGDRDIDVLSGYNAGIEGCLVDFDKFHLSKKFALHYDDMESFANFLLGMDN